MLTLTAIPFRYMQLTLLCIVVCLISGCDSKEDIAPLSQAEEIVSLIPKEIWIDEALTCIESAEATPAKYVLKNALPRFRNELHVFFNQNKEVYKTEVFNAGNKVCALFFEGQRMVYSLHSENDSHPVLVAYANEKPYAAAASSDTAWTATDPNQVKLNLPMISASNASSHQMEEKEQKANYLRRLNTKTDSVNSNIAPFDKHSYVVNASKGDKLHIDLESSSNNVLFTMGPIDGINMEVRNWEGEVSKTGDIRITIFTIEPDSAESYKLFTQIESRY